MLIFVSAKTSHIEVHDLSTCKGFVACIITNGCVCSYCLTLFGASKNEGSAMAQWINLLLNTTVCVTNEKCLHYAKTLTHTSKAMAGHQMKVCLLKNKIT